MALHLDHNQMAETLYRNRATSFGLTLVVGLPFPQPLLARVTDLRAQCEAQWPGRFHWYAPDHLHATVMAPLRGRYREGPPLQRHELPADLDAFAEALNQCFAALKPFPLDLDRLCLAPDGRLLALGENPGRVRSQVAACLAPVAGLDQPKDLNGWHVTLAYLRGSAPLALQVEHTGLQASPLGTMEVAQVWLMHYADRRLCRILGKAPLFLGRPNTLTADGLLVELDIAT